MTSDLRWTPEVPFRYYMLGFRDFVMAKHFDFLDSADAASCFLELLPAVEHVARNQAVFEAESSIYGDFLEKLSRIQALYAPYSTA
jgi:hypothetical protein